MARFLFAALWRRALTLLMLWLLVTYFLTGVFVLLVASMYLSICFSAAVLCTSVDFFCWYAQVNGFRFGLFDVHASNSSSRLQVL